MTNGVFNVPVPRNEPVLEYRPGSPERKELRLRLTAMAKSAIEITPVIGGRRVRTGNVAQATVPHAHKRVLARWHKAGAREVAKANTALRTPTTTGPACRAINGRRSS